MEEHAVERSERSCRVKPIWENMPMSTVSGAARGGRYGRTGR